MILSVPLLGRVGGWQCRDAPKGSSTLGEEEAQIIQGKALGEAFFAKDILGQSGFAALKLAYFLFDALLNQQAVSDDFAGLTDAMSAINGLGFDRRVPP